MKFALILNLFLGVLVCPHQATLDSGGLAGPSLLTVDEGSGMYSPVVASADEGSGMYSPVVASAEGQDDVDLAGSKA
jgi:hypothetical protein